MGLKVCFYQSLENDEYKGKDYCQNIYNIKAGEICSEFIARYFFKPGVAPELLLNKIAKEYYYGKDEEKSRQDISKNIYKVKIDDMLQDHKENFEFKTFKDSKIVREKLLNKYQENLKNAKTDVYALLTLDN